MREARQSGAAVIAAVGNLGREDPTAALVIEQHPDWSARRVAEELRETVAPVDIRNPAYADMLDADRVDAGRAIVCAYA